MITRLKDIFSACIALAGPNVIGISTNLTHLESLSCSVVHAPTLPPTPHNFDPIYLLTLVSLW